MYFYCLVLAYKHYAHVHTHNTHTAIIFPFFSLLRKLVRLLQKKNTHIYLVSGGFRKIIEPVMDYLNIPKENLFANRMIFDSKGLC